MKWFIAATCLCLSAFARETPSQMMVGLGVFNIIKEPKRPQVLLEYRHNADYHNVRPLVGLTFTDRGSIYIYGGAALDIFLGKHFVVAPSFAPGFYFKCAGKELGCVLEFRSCLEAAYILPNKGRLGAMFYHISNASIGFKNPGEESLIFYYAIPLN